VFNLDYSGCIAVITETKTRLDFNSSMKMQTVTFGKLLEE